MKSISSSSSSHLLIFISLLLSFATFTFSSSGVRVIDGLKNYSELRLPNGTSGPESLAFDCHGKGPYTGVSDGRILKWTGTQWVEFAITSPNRNRTLCDGSTDVNNEPICGRPLGLKYDTKRCNLYIADAYFGLLKVGPNGGVAQQLARVDDDGVPFKFLNGLDVDEKSGEVYFSESSAIFQRREFQLIIPTGDRTGRLLKYDPTNKKVQVLLKNVTFANGVALSTDDSFVLIAEFSSSRILKFWLKGNKANTSELFARVERFPDNIKRNKDGDFWVGLFSNRVIGTSTLIPWKKLGDDPLGVKFDNNGKRLEILDGRGGQELNSVSEVKEYDKKLWIGSSMKPYVAVVN
ncbi:protein STRICTOSIDINE SYNTHASE-LIKE 10-like [Senna tora]|uniref:Protein STRICTOSIDINE SYNTHASE-LIKE 10-like n=1 Tax=Senna tora TaxID=362788 RepID=A0A834TX19_9FABA|nr:protein STRICTOSIDINE SYNTHASE-LIKE 10-like [Senna tora]